MSDVQPETFIDKAGRRLTIRLARDDDAAAMIAFVRQVDTESPFLSREPGEFDVPVPTERMFIRQTNAQPNGLFLIATDGPLIVASLDFHGGTRQRIAHAGEFGLSVRRAYWQCGIGSRLLDLMIAWAQANGVTRKIKLRVHAGNERAIALYRSRGFVEEGLLRRDLRIGGAWVDLLLMARWLG